MDKTKKRIAIFCVLICLIYVSIKPTRRLIWKLEDAIRYSKNVLKVNVDIDDTLKGKKIIENLEFYARYETLMERDFYREVSFTDKDDDKTVIIKPPPLSSKTGMYDKMNSEEDYDIIANGGGFYLEYAIKIDKKGYNEYNVHIKPRQTEDYVLQFDFEDKNDEKVYVEVGIELFDGEGERQVYRNVYGGDEYSGWENAFPDDSNVGWNIVRYKVPMLDDNDKPIVKGPNFIVQATDGYKVTQKQIISDNEKETIIQYTVDKIENS